MTQPPQRPRVQFNPKAKEPEPAGAAPPPMAKLEDLSADTLDRALGFIDPSTLPGNMIAAAKAAAAKSRAAEPAAKLAAKPPAPAAKLAPAAKPEPAAKLAATPAEPDELELAVEVAGDDDDDDDSIDFAKLEAGSDDDEPADPSGDAAGAYQLDDPDESDPALAARLALEDDLEAEVETDDGGTATPARAVALEPPGDDEADAGPEDFDFALPDQTERDGVWATCEAAYAPSVAERISRAAVVLRIARAFQPRSTTLDAVAASHAGLAARAADLAGIAAPPDHDAQLAEVGKLLEPVERELADHDKKIPIAWMRRALDDLKLEPADLAHYLRAQLANLEVTPIWWSRIDLLVTRVLRLKQPDGTFAIRAEADAAQALSGIFPVAEVDVVVREAAVRFFRNAMGRIKELTDAEEIFTSGFYVDTSGYKISLKLGYFDLPILYAGTEFSLALGNWLAAQEAAGRDLRTLDAYFNQAYEAINKIFVAQFQDYDYIARFRAGLFRPRVIAPTPVVEEKVDWEGRKVSAKTSNKIFVVLGLAILVAIGQPLFKKIWGEHQRDLKSMSADDAMAFHPLLSSASVTGNPPELLVGEIDHNKWSVLSDHEKQAVAEKLLESMSDRGVKNALIYSNGVVVIHIAGLELRSVE